MKSVPLEDDLHKEVFQYKEFGLIALPLKPNSEMPLFQDWQYRNPTFQWDSAPENSNIGILCGGPKRIAVIECGVGDNENSYKNIIDWLERLDVRQGSYPVVKSPLGFTRHIYFSLAGDLPGESYPLSPEIGDGVIYYGPRTYVIAWPSETNDGVYTLAQGDFRTLPVLTNLEIIKLLDLPIIPSWVKEGSKPIPDYELFGIPALVLALIQGDDIDKYQDLLEMEQAIMISLIKKGYTDSQILSIFLNNPIAGGFREIHDFNTEIGLKWLRLLIEKSKEPLKANHSIDHRLARETIAWAESKPWPGRTGLTDQAVLIAHAKIALRRGQLIYGASVREIAELSGISRTTASIATNRLIDTGFLRKVNPSVGFQSAIYDLIIDGHNQTISICTDCHVMHTHDVFR